MPATPLPIGRLMRITVSVGSPVLAQTIGSRPRTASSTKTLTAAMAAVYRGWYAQASISTMASKGRPATATAARAGRCSPNASTYASFMAA